MSNIIPVRNDAPLPATYEAAQRALAECQRIDECRDWANKAHALASYARQAKDDSLRLTAIRIQNRAIRRAGELLKQIEPSKGGRPSVKTRDHDHPSSRTAAAEQAGLSTGQRKTALRIASVPAAEFEAAIESEIPPTVTQMATMGTVKHLEPAAVAPQAVQPLTNDTGPAANAAVTLLRNLTTFCAIHDPAAIARAVHDPDFARGLVRTIDLWLDKFVTNLPAGDAEGAPF
jgi:hypothetical protein